MTENKGLVLWPLNNQVQVGFGSNLSGGGGLVRIRHHVVGVEDHGFEGIPLPNGSLNSPSY